MLLFAGRREEALALWSEIRETVAEARFPMSFGAAGAAGSVAEGMAFAGEREEAASLYPALADVLRSGLRYGGYGEELVETAAGIAAAAGRDWQAASAHFEAALQQADEMGLASARPLALRSYALMRQDRNQADDREIARRLLTEALDLYEHMGWPRHAELTVSLLT
jgi:tetratricopeptide (TPR) repeat protein